MRGDLYLFVILYPSFVSNILFYVKSRRYIRNVIVTRTCVKTIKNLVIFTIIYEFIHVYFPIFISDRKKYS